MDASTGIPAFENPAPDVRVRALLCEDSEGQVQIIAPEKAIVDPNAVRHITGRDLHCRPAALNRPVCAIPGFYDAPTILHADLRHAEVLALATENLGQYVRSTGPQLYQMSKSRPSFEVQFCVPTTRCWELEATDHEQIHRAVDQFTTRRIEARLDETLHIPPLPDAARRILGLQQDPDFDLSDLVQIIETDPALTARIMGWSNSALYASPTPSKSVHDAIMRVLGIDIVFNMALGMAIGASLNLPSTEVAGANPYWLAAVYNAATMEALAYQIESQDPPNPGTCYLVGLLANFGTLVIGHVFSPQYERICRLQEANPQLHHTYVDQHVLSLNRETIAAALLELWNLPDEVTTSMRFQHTADYRGEHQTYVKLLHLAHILSAHAEAGYESLDGCDLQSTCLELDLDRRLVEEVFTAVFESKSDLHELARAF